MIGLVVVSHSARLAEGVCELAEQVARGGVRLAAAGGSGDPEHPLGTDAFGVLQAIESVWDSDGVIVFTDIGSAVLSAETALEMLDAERRGRVCLCPAPVVEGAVAAAAQAAAGAALAEIVEEAARAAGAKRIPQAGEDRTATLDAVVTIGNPHGLHARPAARLVRLARRFQARVDVENVTRRTGPVSAAGINGLLALGARRHDQLRVTSNGPDAAAALAEVRRFLETGCGEAATAPLTDAGTAAPRRTGRQGEIHGLPGSAGIAIGPLERFQAVGPILDLGRNPDQPHGELERLRASLSAARQETRALESWALAHAGDDEAGIFAAQSLLLEDAEMAGAAARLINDDGLTAEAAWRRVTSELARRIGSSEDAYLASRSADVSDAAERVLHKLGGGRGGTLRLTRPCVVAAHDLTPSEVQQLDPALVLGVCLEMGSAGAHSIILARSMGIPAVVGLGPEMGAVPEGATVALDGAAGTVWVSPAAEQTLALEGARERWLAARAAAAVERSKPARTHDGALVTVLANIGSVAEAAEAVAQGAAGVGVLRTEFLFLHRTAPPDEEEQMAAYRAIADTMDGRPLTIRTLDIGGDKPVPYIDAGEESNPFLGWRGIRLTLARRDILRTQLRAILRAAAGRNVEILLPMISSLDEVRQARALVAEVENELSRQNEVFCRGVALGVMIEVPAAAAIADQLAREASFFSIGTNDLVQYLMAADRTNPRVSPLADALQPAVLRLVRDVVGAGRTAGIGVTLCGELAADTLATPVLIGLGLHEFSVSPPLVPELKHAIGRITVQQAGEAGAAALRLESAAAVREYLKQKQGSYS